MELQHSFVATRKLWRSLKAAFFTTRRGLTSRRKLFAEAYAKAWRKYTHLIALQRASGRSTAPRPVLPAAGHSFRLWELCTDDQYFSVVRSINTYPRSPPTCDFHAELSTLSCNINGGELHHEVPSPAFCSRVHSPGRTSTGDVDMSGDADEDGRLGDEEIDDRAEEFIRKFHEELRAQSRNCEDSWVFL